MSQKQDDKIYLPLVFHFHQPINNFHWIFNEAYQKAYLPLIQTIASYPNLKVNLHFSGSLLLWLQKERPEFLDQVVQLYKERQVEIIGGGFYEPILAVIPTMDKIKQITLMIDWWKDNFNIEPKGIWIAERVWVPNLASVLRKVGVNFTFVDDCTFRSAGLIEEETFHSYITEDEGYSITVFPINEKIRYLIPWKPPDETIDYLSKVFDLIDRKIVVLFSDAEKMGFWKAGDKTTFDICYKDGYNGKPWLSTFFELILKNEWIKTVHITSYMNNNPPKGLIYLPTGSYDKISVWALSTPLRTKLETLKEKAEKCEINYANEILMFSNGSIWQNFLIKYSQANIMHKRMLYCRNRIEKLENTFSQLPVRELKTIWDNILAAQCNDAYWHGVFGGVYHLFLRHTIHKYILRAEYLLDKLMIQERIEIPKCHIIDILLDGNPDVMLNNNTISCFISTSKGGTVFSLNFKEKGYNFINTLTRIYESYHTKSMPVISDRFEKWSFQDHFFYSDVSEEALYSDDYEELGDFANKVYNIIQNDDESVSLLRRGVISLENRKIKSSIIKKYHLKFDKLFITYSIEFSETIKSNLLIFSPEINLSINSYPYKAACTIGESNFDLSLPKSFEKCCKVQLKDLNEEENVSVIVKFPEETNLSLIPIISISKNDNGYKKEYQGTSLFPRIKINKKQLSFTVELQLESLNGII